MQKKLCTKCGKEKTLRSFPKDKNVKINRAARCKKCKNVYRKFWARKTRSRYKRYDKDYKLKKAYGISLEEYEDMFNKQNGSCAICDEFPKRKMLSVDHCHKTNKIRGLLCSNCNTGIGLFRDNIELFKKAIKYVEEI